MKSWYLSTAARFDARPSRERALVMLAALLLLVAAGYALAVDPALRRGAAAGRAIAETSLQLTETQNRLSALKAPETHPDAAARAELEALRGRLDALGGKLQALESALVPPDRMPALLEAMIGARNGLRLLSLKTLPAEPLSAGKEENGNGSAPAGLYRHGVEVRLEGSYQDLTDYLDRLEQSPMKILWGRAVLSSEQHPRLVLTLTVHSLSMDRAWLKV